MCESKAHVHVHNGTRIAYWSHRDIVITNNMLEKALLVVYSELLQIIVRDFCTIRNVR